MLQTMIAGKHISECAVIELKQRWANNFFFVIIGIYFEFKGLFVPFLDKFYVFKFCLDYLHQQINIIRRI